MVAKCTKMEFIMYGEEGGYLVQVLETSSIWGDTQTKHAMIGRRFDKTSCMQGWYVGSQVTLRREGADPKVQVMLYMEVIQEVLLFGAETWVLLVAMERKLQGTNMSFIQQIMEKRAQRFPYGTWETPGAETVQEAAVMQSKMTYIERQQATVAQWVEL